MSEDWIESYITAGKAVIKAKKLAQRLVKPGVSYYEVANSCENIILDSGCELSLPVLTSLNEVASDYCPLVDDYTLIPESGLLKITFGSHYNGYIAKSAITFNLNNQSEYRYFLEGIEVAFGALTNNFKPGKKMYEIGEIIAKNLIQFNLRPITNLGGHEMKQFIHHAGVFIPSYKDTTHNTPIMQKSVYACIIFATNGRGTVVTGNRACIYKFNRIIKKNIPYEMISYLNKIKTLSKNMPFSINFIKRHKIIPENKIQYVLNYLVEKKILNQFSVLIESSHAPVAEIADTILIDDEGNSIVITQDSMTYKEDSISLLEKEDVKEVEEIMKNDIDSEPSSSREFKRWVKRGVNSGKEGNFEEAIRCFDQALNINSKSEEALVYKATALLSLKRLEEAHNLINKALEINEKYEKGWNLKGRILGMLGKFDDALQSLDKAIEINPKGAGPYHEKGALYMSRKNPEKALEYFNKAINIDPKFIGGWLSKGFALSVMKKFEEALNCFNEVIKIDPNFKEARRLKAMLLKELGRDDEAVDTLDILTSKDPEDLEAWLNKGIELLMIKHDSEALECFERAIQLNPDSYKAWGLKGVALRELDQTDEALKCFDKAISLNPNDFTALGEKIKTFISLKDFDKALILCDESLTKYPNSHDLLFLRGQVFWFKKDFKQSIECFDKSLKIKPDFQPAIEAKKVAAEMLKIHPPEEEIKKLLLSEPTDAAGFYNKAYALSLVGDNQKAIEMYDEALKLEPNMIQAIQNKAVTLSHLKRFDEALECFDEALKINPNDFRLLSNKGAALMSLKRSEEALKIIEKALELQPNYDDGWVNKGSILANYEKHSEALACYEKAIEINPFSDKAWYNKSIVLRKLGRVEEAEKAKKEAISINPALDKSDIVAIIDSKSFWGESKRGPSQRDMVCEECGSFVNFGDKYCKQCGTPLGKGGDKVPFIHIGPGGPSMETFDLKKLKIHDIPPLDEKIEPQEPFKLPSMEEMQNFMEYSDKGAAFAQQKRFDEALEWFDKALDLMPHAWITLSMKANVLQQAGRDEEVIKVTDELCHYHPYKADGWYFRGLSMINVGKVDEGYRCLQNAVKIDPRMQPAQDQLNFLNTSHPHNLTHILPQLKDPIRKTYTLVYNVFNQVDSSEWISFRIFDIMKGGFVENARIKKYDIEFKQTEFKEYLPKVLYPVIKQEGFFICYVGKFDSLSKRTLFLGYLEELFGLDTLTQYSLTDKGLKVFPFYEEIVHKYERIQAEWKDIWTNKVKYSLRFYFNFQLLEDYLDSLKLEFK